MVPKRSSRRTINFSMLCWDPLAFLRFGCIYGQGFFPLSMSRHSIRVRATNPIVTSIYTIPKRSSRRTINFSLLCWDPLAFLRFGCIYGQGFFPLSMSRHSIRVRATNLIVKSIYTVPTHSTRRTINFSTLWDPLAFLRFGCIWTRFFFLYR
jgi:hypothetical protein